MVWLTVAAVVAVVAAVVVFVAVLVADVALVAAVAVVAAVAAVADDACTPDVDAALATPVLEAVLAATLATSLDDPDAPAANTAVPATMPPAAAVVATSRERQVRFQRFLLACDIRP
ncbi:MAG: hypothetical protein AB7Q27_29800 [Acidimicrobiia bacterium]